MIQIKWEHKNPVVVR